MAPDFAARSEIRIVAKRGYQKACKPKSVLKRKAVEPEQIEQFPQSQSQESASVGEIQDSQSLQSSAAIKQTQKKVREISVMTDA